MAETPAPTLAGVERVVMACEADSTLTAADAKAICAQLVKKAQTVTSLPVIAASAAAIPQLPGLGEQLVLHVGLSAEGAADRGTLAMTVTPSRNYLRLNQGASLKSQAQLARLAGQLVIQGPVPAFAQILGAAPPKLHRPIKDNIYLGKIVFLEGFVMGTKTVFSGAKMDAFAPDVLEIHNTSLTASGGFVAPTSNASADPYAGTVAANGKEIWDVQHAADNLHRSGTDWTHDNYGALDDGVLTYGFWTYEQFMQSYFFELQYSDGSAYNDDAYFAETYGMFEAFRADQQVAAANALAMWDDLITVKFQAAPAGTEADIMFGAVYEGPGVGAHAYYPQAEALDGYYGTEEYGKTSGDVMINWLYNAPNGGSGGTIVNRAADNSFSNFSYGSYGNFAITHELGHSLGLSHGGDYNASSGGGAITYTKDAYFYQDSQQYTIMSYFSGNVTGQSGANLDNLTILYAQTPAVHDIYTVQQIYGADMSTRSGDTVYGFNSTADKGVYDFTLNSHPVLTIWDGGGNDTLDLSGFNSNSIIDLNEGAFSSAGNKVTDAVKAADMAALGITSEAQWQAFLAKYALNSDGSLHDNIGIAYGAKIENAIGGVGNDTMTGNALNNFLSGGAGNDVIKGGAGIDVISLGAGNDIFKAEITADKTSFKGPVKGKMSMDIITDFTTGQDHIDLSGLGGMSFKGSAATKGHDLTFKTFDSVNGAENALGIDIDGHQGASDIAGPVTVVFGNVDGGDSDFAIVLLNHSGVTASDFIFA